LSKGPSKPQGARALAAVKDKGWDVSVTSLVAFPQVLAMMNSKLDWTQKIGDAMIAQQSDVRLLHSAPARPKVQAACNLKTTPQQTVTQQPASAGAPAGHARLRSYPPADQSGHGLMCRPNNPNWAYGSWPYPDYPPSYFPPTDYWLGRVTMEEDWGDGLYLGVLVRFSCSGLGFAVGGAFFGGWNWWRRPGRRLGLGGMGRLGASGNSYTTINVNRATYITNNFNRNYYHDDHWNHDPAHRHGVPYRDQASRERYDQHHPDAAQRQAFRGKIDQEPRTSGLQGAGQHRDDGNRGTEGRKPLATRIGVTKAGATDWRGNDWRGNENHGGAHRSAFHGVNHGNEVHREANRGHSYAHHASYHPRGGGGGMAVDMAAGMEAGDERDSCCDVASWCPFS